MPIYEVEVNGKVFEVDSPTPPTADVIAKLSGQSPNPPVNGTPRGGMLATAGDVAVGAAKGAAGTVVGLGKAVQAIPGVSTAVDALYGQPGLSKQAFGEADAALEPTNTAQSVGKGLETAAEIVLPVGGGIVKGIKALPSAARAGANFQKVMGAAKSIPVDISGPGNVALRIQQLAERGGTMPKVVRDFVKRVTDPSKPDLAYEEARDFYHNISRLSANEFQRLTPVVSREVFNLRMSLNKSLEKAADAAGKLPEYQAAMKEYAQAAKGKALVKNTKDAVIRKLIPGGLAIYGTERLIKAVRGN